MVLCRHIRRATGVSGWILCTFKALIHTQIIWSVLFPFQPQRLQQGSDTSFPSHSTLYQDKPLNSCHWLDTSAELSKQSVVYEQLLKRQYFGNRSPWDLLWEACLHFRNQWKPCGGGGIDLKKWNRAGGCAVCQSACSYRPPSLVPSLRLLLCALDSGGKRNPIPWLATERGGVKLSDAVKLKTLVEALENSGALNLTWER